MQAWRIGNARYPVFSGTGAATYGGRWNSQGREVIYAASTFSLAILEILVHAQIGKLPPSRSVVEITIPDDVAIETLDGATLPGWDAADCAVSCPFGDRWIDDARTAVLLVPSVVSPYEPNVAINPHHPAFSRITPSPEQPLSIDARLRALFAPSPG